MTVWRPQGFFIEEHVDSIDHDRFVAVGWQNRYDVTAWIQYQDRLCFPWQVHAFDELCSLMKLYTAAERRNLFLQIQKREVECEGAD